MFAIVFVFPGGEKVPGATYPTRATAERMKAHYEKPRNASQHGVAKIEVVSAKEGN